MAIAFKDRVKTECTTIGTGDIVFGATRHGFQDWSKIPNGEKVYYCLLNVDEWEVGYGIKSTGGIQRNVLDSTTGSKISLTGGADVFLTYPADGVVAKDESGNLIIDGTITATEVYADNLTLEGLGLANHEKIIVDTNGVISGDGGGLTNLNIDLADNGLANHDKITVDELGNLGANSISIDTSLGYPNNWSVTGQPTSFNVSQSGATKASVGSDGKLTATGFVGDGSELTGLNIPEALPDQTGQNGKYLQTDGAVATWQEVVGGGEGTVADGCIYLNNQVITSDYVFPLGKNGMSGGPISIDGSVEVGDGTWTIVGESGLGGGSGGGSVETVDAPVVKLSNLLVNDLPSNVDLLMQFQTKDEDSHNCWDVATSRLTPTVAGWYEIKASAFAPIATDARFSLTVNKNNAPITTFHNGGIVASGGGNTAVTTLQYANGTTDYFQFYIATTNTSTIQLNNSPINTWASAVLVKPANSGTLVGGEPVTLDALGIPNHDRLSILGDGVTNTQVSFDNDAVTTSVSCGAVNDRFVIKNGHAERVAVATDGVTNISGHLGVGRDPTNFKNFAIETRPSAVGATHGLNVELNDAGFIASCSRTDRTAMSGLRSVDGWGTIGLHVNSADRFTISDTRCDISVPLYVQGNPKSIDVVLSDMETKLADRDKLIDKLMARIETLEKKVK